MASSNTSDFDLEEKTWHIIDKYFKNGNRLVAHHVDSFNHLISEDLPKIIKEKDFQITLHSNWSETLKKYLKTYYVNFENFYISKPLIYENNGISKLMYPNQARLRNMTYESPFYIDISHRLEEIDEKTEKKVVKEYPTLKKELCGAIPIMLKSKYCILSEQNNVTNSELGEGYFDIGGYFVVKGGEKAVIPQEKM